MQYNSNSDNQDIVSLIGDITGIDTVNELKQITRSANEANKKIWTWIFQSYGSWQYDDSNNSDLPIATAALVANQQKYTLPTEALTVKAVEWKNSGGTWQKLNAIPIERINQWLSENEWNDTPAEPRNYSLVNGIFKLYPASDTARSEALRIQFDRGSTSFASTSTTQTPGFVSEFHEAVAVGAGYFIARNKKLPNKNDLLQDWIDIEKRIKNFYIAKWEEEFPPRFHTMDTLRQYM